MPSGISGRQPGECASVDLQGLQVTGVDTDDRRPGVDRALTSSAVCTSTSGVSPIDSGPLDEGDQLGSDSAATISSTRSAPAARASKSW